MLALKQKLGSDPSHTVYIEDTDSDVKMAKNDGVISVGMLSGAQPQKRLRSKTLDYIIPGFRDLPREKGYLK